MSGASGAAGYPERFGTSAICAIPPFTQQSRRSGKGRSGAVWLSFAPDASEAARPRLASARRFCIVRADRPESFVAAQFSHPFAGRARFMALAALLALLLAACGKYGPLEPPPDPNAPPKPANTNPNNMNGLDQAVDSADRAAEAAVLPRFPAEISFSRECAPSPIATALLHAEDVALATIAEAVGTPVLLLFERRDRTEFRGVPRRVRWARTWPFSTR